MLQSADFSVLLATGEERLLSLQGVQGVCVEGGSSGPRQQAASNSSNNNSSFRALLRRELHENQELAARVGSALERGQAAVGTEELRRQAQARQQRAEQARGEARGRERELQRLGLLGALPRLCDSLRSLALARNLSCFPLPALLAALAEEAGATCPLLARPPLLDRNLRALARLVPEFAQVFPADAVLPHESVRLNLRAPYSSVRRKVKAAADAAREETGQLLRAQGPACLSEGGGGEAVM
jgi:hypothetical protein